GIFRGPRAEAPQLGARPDLETGVGPIAVGLRWLIAHFVHLREPLTAPCPGDELRKRRRIALQQGLDAAIGAIAHPTRDAEPQRLIAQRVAVAHALHAPYDTNLPRPHASRPSRC